MTKAADLLIVSMAIILSSLLMWIYILPPLLGGMLFTLLPVAYLGFRSPKPWKVLLGTSFTLGFLLGFIFDFIQSYNGAWSVDNLLIPWRVMGIMPIDNAIGYFLMTLLTLTFYEHFFQRTGGTHLPFRFYKISGVLMFVLATVLLLAGVSSSILEIPYTYLVGGTAAVIATLIAGSRHPELIKNLCSISVFFFFVWLLAEIVAVSTGGWTYPSGEYIGWVELFDVRFPIEELLFWMIWYSPFLVLGYEHLLRDKKKLISQAQ